MRSMKTSVRPSMSVAGCRFGRCRSVSQGQDQPHQLRAIAEALLVSKNCVSELTLETFEFKFEVCVPRLTRTEEAVELGIPPDLRCDPRKLDVPAHAQHRRRGQQFHELVGVLGTHNLVVELAEETDAVRERDEIPPVGVDPAVVGRPAPLDFIAQLLGVEGREIALCDLVRLPVHRRQQLELDPLTQNAEVVEAPGQTQVPRPLVALTSSRGGHGARLQKNQPPIGNRPFHVLRHTEERFSCARRLEDPGQTFFVERRRASQLQRHLLDHESGGLGQPAAGARSARYAR